MGNNKSNYIAKCVMKDGLNETDFVVSFYSANCKNITHLIVNEHCVRNIKNNNIILILYLNNTDLEITIKINQIETCRTDIYDKNDIAFIDLTDDNINQFSKKSINYFTYCSFFINNNEYNLLKNVKLITSQAYTHHDGYVFSEHNQEVEIIKNDDIIIINKNIMDGQSGSICIHSNSLIGVVSGNTEPINDPYHTLISTKKADVVSGKLIKKWLDNHKEKYNKCDCNTNKVIEWVLLSWLYYKNK